MERQLLLAGNIAGLRLSSTLAPGTIEGATTLVVEAEHQLISGEFHLITAKQRTG